MIGFFKNRSHNRLRTLLSSYIDGEVSAAESGQVEDHLASCEECRLELDSLRSTVNLMNSLPELAVPRSFVLTQEPAPVRSASPMIWTTRLATSVAALLLFALVMGDAFGILSQASLAQQEAAVISPPVPERAALAPPQSQTFSQASRTEQAQQGTAGQPGLPGASSTSMPSAPQPAARAIAEIEVQATSVPAPQAPIAAATNPPSVSEPSAPVQPAAPAQALQAQAAPAPQTADDARPEDELDILGAAVAEVPEESAAGIAAGEAAQGSIPAASEMPVPEETSTTSGNTAPDIEPGQATPSTASPLTTSEDGAPLTQYAIESGSDDDDQPTFAAGDSDNDWTALSKSSQGTLESTSQSRGLDLPLRQLEIAAGAILIVFVIVSLLIARRNGLWPFSR